MAKKSSSVGSGVAFKFVSSEFSIPKQILYTDIFKIRVSRVFV